MTKKGTVEVNLPECGNRNSTTHGAPSSRRTSLRKNQSWLGVLLSRIFFALLSTVWSILLDPVRCAKRLCPESLFSATASAERKSWGFSVIEQALKDIPPNEIPLLFTKNFMRTWINHLSNQDRFLHKAARHLVL
jgi:hypothetical protein